MFCRSLGCRTRTMCRFVRAFLDVMPGDYIYMFSDGYTDQLDASCHKFTPRRLRQLLCDINAKTKVAAEQAKILDEEFNKWRKDVPQIDDILIGGYCIK